MARRLIFILIGPSGTGKTTLIQRMLQDYPELRKHVTYTTRPPRHEEVNGVDYHFVSHAEFERMRSEGKMVEWNPHFENLYGSTYDSVSAAIKGDFDRITSLEVLGAEKLQSLYPDDVATIFISPPSLEEARRRREKRPDETPAQEIERDNRAVMEMEHAGNFRYALVNDDLEAAVINVAAIIRAEHCARFVRDIKQMGLLNLLALHRSEMNHT